MADPKLEVTIVVLDSQTRGDKVWVKVQAFVHYPIPTTGPENVGEAEWLDVGSSLCIRIPLEVADA